MEPMSHKCNCMAAPTQYLHARLFDRLRLAHFAHLRAANIFPASPTRSFAIPPLPPFATVPRLHGLRDRILHTIRQHVQEERNFDAIGGSLLELSSEHYSVPLRFRDLCFCLRDVHPPLMASTTELITSAPPPSTSAPPRCSRTPSGTRSNQTPPSKFPRISAAHKIAFRMWRRRWATVSRLSAPNLATSKRIHAMPNRMQHALRSPSLALALRMWMTPRFIGPSPARPSVVSEAFRRPDAPRCLVRTHTHTHTTMLAACPFPRSK